MFALPVTVASWSGVRSWLPDPGFGDRVLATLLFTDIVGSTELAARLGDGAWRELLGRHDREVRNVLDRHRGREVKTTGDGFLALFDGAGRASPLRSGGASSAARAFACPPTGARRPRAWAVVDSAVVPR